MMCKVYSVLTLKKKKDFTLVTGFVGVCDAGVKRMALLTLSAISVNCTRDPMGVLLLSLLI